MMVYENANIVMLLISSKPFYYFLTKGQMWISLIWHSKSFKILPCLTLWFYLSPLPVLCFTLCQPQLLVDPPCTPCYFSLYIYLYIQLVFYHLCSNLNLCSNLCSTTKVITLPERFSWSFKSEIALPSLCTIYISVHLHIITIYYIDLCVCQLSQYMVKLRTETVLYLYLYPWKLAVLKMYHLVDYG